MKRIHATALMILLILSALLLTACGRSEFGVTGNTEKRMTITAERADRDASITAGALETDDGEQITIAADLTRGSVRVEIIAVPGEENIDEHPDTDGEAIITADLDSTEAASGSVPAGSYLVKATCLETATGTVQIEVTPAP